LKRAGRLYPGVTLTADAAEVLKAPDIDAIAVITPVWTHFDLAKAALENGKHVFVEKPFTSTSEQAEQLIALAERKHLQIMVDHTFLFSGAVKKIRELVDNGTLGSLYYFDSTRVNLGLFQHDVKFQLNINNVGDKLYADRYLGYAEPRTIRFSATARF
jgi:predicted dehydrogenase